MTRPPKPSKSFDHMATSRLWEAARRDDVDAAKKALAAGANPNAKGPSMAPVKESILDVACDNGSLKVVALLLRSGARLVPTQVRAGMNTMMGKSPTSPAHRAARFGEKDLIAVLASHKAMSALRPLLPDGSSPLSCALMGDISVNSITLNENPDCLALVDEWLSYPGKLKDTSKDFKATAAIYRAAISTHPPSILPRLVAAGLDPLCIPESSNPLHYIAGYMAGFGVNASNKDKVHENMQGWIEGLALLGVPWPSSLQTKPEAYWLKAQTVYEKVRLAQALPESSLLASRPRM